MSALIYTGILAASSSQAVSSSLMIPPSGQAMSLPSQPTPSLAGMPSGRTKPFCWTTELTCSALELFREQVNNGLKTATGGLKERAYTNVANTSNKHCSVNVSIKQVKNKYKHLQDKAIIWFTLLSQSGFGCDEETETVQADNHV
ncbi:hypothetical protein F4804DRAFT_337158 [Jackrogersella minutella]|nr:hypothetical protein F4804DRAFT_337158 [Jackrogersella minutella]